MSLSKLDHLENQSEMYCQLPGRLPEPVVCPNTAIVNQHVLDAFIRFEETGHHYYLRTDEGIDVKFPLSVSGVWKKYFDHFDADAVIALYYKKWCSDPLHRYYAFITELQARGVPDDAIQRRIKQTWADAGDVASAQGTKMHKQIELALCGLEYDTAGV